MSNTELTAEAKLLIKMRGKINFVMWLCDAVRNYKDYTLDDVVEECESCITDIDKVVGNEVHAEVGRSS